MPQKKENKSNQKRSKVIYTRVTDDEHKEITHRSKMCGITTSNYLRNLAIQLPSKKASGSIF
jgi:hypothetical protein